MSEQKLIAPTVIINGGWVDTRDQKVLADMRRMREEEQAARLRLQNETVQLSPLEILQSENRALRAKVSELQAELDAERAKSPVSPHLRHVEKRS